MGKANTVMALNNSNVLLPCTFTTCIGFQDLVFVWYFNSTEMVGGSLSFASVSLAGPFVLSQSRPALRFSEFTFSSCRRQVPPSVYSVGLTQKPWHTRGFGSKLFWIFCCPQGRVFHN